MRLFYAGTKIETPPIPTDPVMHGLGREIDCASRLTSENQHEGCPGRHEVGRAHLDLKLLRVWVKMCEIFRHLRQRAGNHVREVEVAIRGGKNRTNTAGTIMPMFAEGHRNPDHHLQSAHRRSWLSTCGCNMGACVESTTLQWKLDFLLGIDVVLLH